jgi:TATA-binding protein-associated factor Taf7
MVCFRYRSANTLHKGDDDDDDDDDDNEEEENNKKNGPNNSYIVFHMLPQYNSGIHTVAHNGSLSI